MDGIGKVEDELVVIMTFCKDNTASKVKSLVRYFNLEEPKRADADGLIAFLQESLQVLGVVNVHTGI